MLHNRKFQDDFRTFRSVSKSFFYQLMHNRVAIREY